MRESARVNKDSCGATEVFKNGGISAVLEIRSLFVQI